MAARPGKLRFWHLLLLLSCRSPPSQPPLCGAGGRNKLLRAHFITFMASPTWYRFTDAAGTNVFMNYESGEISMTMPLEFFSPGFSGWIPCSDATGSTWWGSVYTGEVSWEPPVKGLSLPHTPREQGEDPQQGTARSITPPSVPWSLSPSRLRRERSPNPPHTQQLPKPYTPHHSPSQQPLDRHLLPRSVSPHPPPAIGTPRLAAGVFPIRSTSPPPSSQEEVDGSTTGRGPQLSFPTQPPRLGTLHHFSMPSPPAHHIVAAPPPPLVPQHPAVRPRSRSPPMLTASSRVYLQQQQQQQQVLQHQQHHPVRPRSRSPPQLSASSHDQHLQQHHQQQRQQPSPASVYLRGRVRAPSPPLPSAFSSSRPRSRSPQPHASFSFTHPPTSSSSSLAPSAKLPLLSQGSPPQRQPWQQNAGGGGIGVGEAFDRLPTSPPPSHLHRHPRSTSPFSSGIPVAQRPPSPFAGDGFRSALHASVSPVGEALASLQAREAIKYLQSAPGSGWGGGGVGGKKSSVSSSSSSSSSERSGTQGSQVGVREQRSSPRSKSTAAIKPLSTVLYSYVQDLSEMHVAAIVIQAVFRGYVARKRHEGWIAKWRRY